MTTVWCVFSDYGVEGRELEGIYLIEADADAYIENNKSYSHLVKEEWPIR